MNLLKMYYQIKLIIPRFLQILLRSAIVRKKRKKYKKIWPIDEYSGNPPEGWNGWLGGKKFALVLHHDVDTKKGREKSKYLIEVEEKMGFRSSFNFVPERYEIPSNLRKMLEEKGFEVCVHGLRHDGKLFSSRKEFLKQARLINHYLSEWNSIGFVSPSMHNNLDWIGELRIKHDCSTFDTDPFEPQPKGVRTIFPFLVSRSPSSLNSIRSAQSNNSLSPTPCFSSGELTESPSNSNTAALDSHFVELPYTLPQDFTLFILMREKSIEIWKKKLDWIAKKGGMALLITHPDYMNFDNKWGLETYPAKFYIEFLDYVRSKYDNRFWNVLPKEIAYFWKKTFLEKANRKL